MLTNPILEEARRTLTRRRHALIRLAASHRADEDLLLGEREADWEDTAAEVRDAAVLGRLAASELRELQEIEAALSRLQAGTWGFCRSCGDPIDTRRLRALPEATVCVSCAELAELGRKAS